MGGRRQLSSSSLTCLQHTPPNPWPGPVLALAVLSAEAILLETHARLIWRKTEISIHN